MKQKLFLNKCLFFIPKGQIHILKERASKLISSQSLQNKMQKVSHSVMENEYQFKIRSQQNACITVSFQIFPLIYAIKRFTFC